MSDASDNPRRWAALALVARWESRAWLHDQLEKQARQRLLAGGLVAEEIDELIEQQLLTEQTEYIAEFFFMLRVSGCYRPEGLAAFIDPA